MHRIAPRIGYPRSRSRAANPRSISTSRWWRSATPPNPLLPKTDGELAQSPRGTLIADAETGQTTKRSVFADGDIVTGGATVILAMGAGRRAAASIDAYLGNDVWEWTAGPASTESESARTLP